MWILHIASLAHICISNEVINVKERECFFGSYSAFETAASIAAYAAGCPENDCTQPCNTLDSTIVECKTLGVLVNYRELCSGYYATKVQMPIPFQIPFNAMHTTDTTPKVMPKVYEACGLLGAELQSNSIPTCQQLDDYIFNPRIPSCHGNSAPSPETASFAVFYVLITVSQNTPQLSMPTYFFNCVHRQVFTSSQERAQPRKLSNALGKKVFHQPPH